MGWFGWGSDGKGGDVNVKVTHTPTTTKTEVLKSSDGDRSNHSHQGITRDVFTGKTSSFHTDPKKSR